jgi:hypothetical protein
MLIKHFSLCLSLFAGHVGLTLGAVLDYQFDIANTVAAPDGFPRPIIAVNGAFPGTPIYAQKGDIVRVNVSNQLTDRSMRMSTSIVRLPLAGMVMITSNSSSFNSTGMAWYVLRGWNIGNAYLTRSIIVSK